MSRKKHNNSLFILNSFNFNFLRCEVELINVCNDSCGLNVHQDKWRNDVDVSRVKGSRCWAGIYVEFIFMLVRFEFVRVACYQNIHVELSLNERKCFCISVWNYLMPMTETDSKLANSDDFLFWVWDVLKEK